MMRNILTAAIAAIIAVQAHAAGPAAADTHQLMWLAQRMDLAWTAGDAEANAQLFADDATARFGDEPLAQGREAIRQQFEQFFSERPAGLRHVTTIERVEQLAPDLAQWDAEVRVERQSAGGPWVTLTRIRNVTIATRQTDGWRIKTVRAFPVSQ